MAWGKIFHLGLVKKASIILEEKKGLIKRYQVKLHEHVLQ